MSLSSKRMCSRRSRLMPFSRLCRSSCIKYTNWVSLDLEPPVTGFPFQVMAKFPNICTCKILSPSFVPIFKHFLSFSSSRRPAAQNRDTALCFCLLLPSAFPHSGSQDIEHGAAGGKADQIRLACPAGIKHHQFSKNRVMPGHPPL